MRKSTSIAILTVAITAIVLATAFWFMGRSKPTPFDHIPEPDGIRVAIMATH